MKAKHAAWAWLVAILMFPASVATFDSIDLADAVFGDSKTFWFDDSWEHPVTRAYVSFGDAQIVSRTNRDYVYKVKEITIRGKTFWTKTNE